jgi:hypothetical protein
MNVITLDLDSLTLFVLPRIEFSVRSIDGGPLECFVFWGKARS